MLLSIKNGKLSKHKLVVLLNKFGVDVIVDVVIVVGNLKGVVVDVDEPIKLNNGAVVVVAALEAPLVAAPEF